MNKVVKRSVIIRGRKTSISLEDQFWAELKTIALARALTRAELICNVDRERNGGSNLSSALRCFVLEQYRPRPEAVAATPGTARRPEVVAEGSADEPALKVAGPRECDPPDRTRRLVARARPGEPTL
jgi:predicted DNA-binding ribbon-helix-helix protein